MAPVTLPVTVVLPVRNEAESIAAVLHHLMAQSRLPSEVLFCDGESTDGTPGLIEAWWREHGPEEVSLRVLANPKILPGAGRNLGIAQARLPWVAFLDGGITPERDWLESLFACAEAQGAQAMFGICDFGAEGLVARATCALSYGHGAVYPVVPASLFSKDMLAVVGPFREDLVAAEDILWVGRVKEVCGSQPICLKARVHYRNFPASVARAMAKWRRAEAHVFRANVRRGRQGMLLLIPLVLAGLLAMATTTALALIGGYLALRGLVIPLRRGKTAGWWRRPATLLLATVALAPLLDLSRWLGVIDGLLVDDPGDTALH